MLYRYLQAATIWSLLSLLTVHWGGDVTSLQPSLELSPLTSFQAPHTRTPGKTPFDVEGRSFEEEGDPEESELDHLPAAPWLGLLPPRHIRPTHQPELLPHDLTRLYQRERQPRAPPLA